MSPFQLLCDYVLCVLFASHKLSKNHNLCHLSNKIKRRGKEDKKGITLG